MQNPFSRSVKTNQTTQSTLVRAPEVKPTPKGLFEETIEGPLTGARMPPNFRVLDEYPLLPPFAYALIAENPVKRLPMYFMEETPLTPEETDLYTKIIAALEVEIEAPEAGDDLRKYFSEQALRTANRYRLTKKTKTPISWAKSSLLRREGHGRFRCVGPHDEGPEHRGHYP